MKINVITTLEYDIDEDKELTYNDLGNIYHMFREFIKEATESGDITGFKFVNADTNNEIENEVEE